MIYEKSSGVSGKWAKASELAMCNSCKIVSEAKPEPSQFQDKNGQTKNQDVAKVQFDGQDEPLNVSLNRATKDGLISAFGKDSKDWQGKKLSVETEKMRVGGKAVTALYLIPEGFVRTDDANGYAVIVKEGEEADAPEIEE